MPTEEKQRELLRKVRRIQIHTAHLIRNLFGGQYHSAFKGRGMAFSEVREYLPGDDIRSIDWNVTARMSAPYIKQFVEERELTLMLLVDISRSGRFGSGAEAIRDRSAELAAILAMSAIQNNDRVGLILFTDRVELFVPPRKGAAHALRLIRDLLFFEPVGRLTRIRAGLDFFNRVIRRRAVAFLISDFRAPDVFDALAVTARRHDCVAARMHDPFEREWPRIGLIELEDLESGRTVLFDTSSARARADLRERAAAFSDDLTEGFKSLKIDALSFRTDQSVVDPLRRFFYQRRRRKVR